MLFHGKCVGGGGGEENMFFLGNYHLAFEKW